MPRLKIVVLSAAGAGFLAFISALFGRVSFGAILLRSLFWAGVFGIFSLGLQVLLEKLIPELFESASELAEGPETEEEFGSNREAKVGNNLNIVLEDEEPAFAVAGEDDSGEDSGEEDEDEFIEEIQAVENEDESAQGNAHETDSGIPNGEEPEEEVAEIGTVSNVDSLPNLSDFSDSFDSVSAAQDEADHYSGQSGEDVDLLGTHHDPATVAKAVRTIIGRDQEG